MTCKPAGYFQGSLNPFYLRNRIKARMIEKSLAETMDKVNGEEMRKNILINLGIIAAFFFVGAAVAVKAQTKSRLFVDIPFDFYINDRKQPAGEYEVARLDLGGNQTTVVFRQKNRKASTIVTLLPLLVSSKQSSKQAGLIFNRYDSNYYLTEVINPAENFGGQLRKTKGEIRLAKNSPETKQETIPMKERGQ